MWVVALVFFGFWTLYDAFFAGLLLRRQTLNTPTKDYQNSTVQVLIPAYREGGLLIETARAALNMHAPKCVTFKVIILAQELDEEWLQQLRELPVEVLEMPAMGSKFNALKWYFSTQIGVTDFTFILDSDNRAAPAALQTALQSLSPDVAAVQLKRKKTIPQTTLGLLDFWNTAIGVQLANASRSRIKLNPFILGSGFLVRSALYADFLLSVENTIVEDKRFDLYLASHHHSIVYNPGSFVLDSTTGNKAAFQGQRERWVGGRISMGSTALKLWLQHPSNIDLLDKAIHFLKPQRSLFLSTFLLFLILVISFAPHSIILGSTAVLILQFLANFIATPRTLRNITLLKAFAAVPFAIGAIALARVRSKSVVKNEFKVTPK